MCQAPDNPEFGSVYVCVVCVFVCVCVCVSGMSALAAKAYTSLSPPPTHSTTAAASSSSSFRCPTLVALFVGGGVSVYVMLLQVYSYANNNFPCR